MRLGIGRGGPMLLACVLCLPALAFPAGASARFPGNPLREVWCAPLSGDSVCRWRGLVWAADSTGASLAPGELLSPRLSRLIGSGGTRVMTGPNAIARLHFRNRARCSLGGNGQAGDYFAHPSEEVLFNQYLGYSLCTSIRGGIHREAGILCSPEETCPVTMRWNGTYFVKSEPQEATASVTDTYVRRARIVVCSGSVRIMIDHENAFSEGFGEASGNNRYLIVVEDIISTTYADQIGSATTGSRHTIRIALSRQQQGPGACASSSVEEQEHMVTP